jgi:hypothetical protein
MASKTNETVKCICGRTHRHGGIWVTQAGIEHGCRYAAAIHQDQEMRSARNIAEKAAEFRAEAEARLAQAARGRLVERALRLAEAAYAAVYELENGTGDVLEAMNAGYAAIRG